MNMTILAARKYVSPRERPLTPEEADTRRLAYALKVPTDEAIWDCATEMAAMIPSSEEIILSPMPSSTGDLDANRALANRIAGHLKIRGCKVYVRITVARMHPVESSCARRRKGGIGLAPEEHAMIRVCGPISLAPLYFVDNVVTTGNTMEAARAAMGYGAGIVFADAASKFNQKEVLP